MSNIDETLKEIDRWHRQRGFLKIGYQFVIRRDGTLETGRALEDVGAHTTNFNSRSVGICLVGGLDEQMKPEANFTPEQWAALEKLVKGLKSKHYPNAQVIGHRDVAAKECPCFDVKSWWSEITK